MDETFKKETVKNLVGRREYVLRVHPAHLGFITVVSTYSVPFLVRVTKLTIVTKESRQAKRLIAKAKEYSTQINSDQVPVLQDGASATNNNSAEIPEEIPAHATDDGMTLIVGRS